MHTLYKLIVMFTMLWTAHFISSEKEAVWPDRIDLKMYRIVSSDGKDNENTEHKDKNRESNSFLPPPT